MNNKGFVLRILLVLILVLGYLSFEILRPYLSAIVWAVVLSIVFYPLHRLVLMCVRRNGLASAISLVIILLIVVGPISYLVYLLVSEVGALVGYIKTRSFDGSTPSLITSEIERILSTFGISGPELTKTIADNVSIIWKKIAEQMPRRAGAILFITFDFLLMAVALFFLLKDGPQFLRKALDAIPFSAIKKEQLKTQVKEIVVSSVYGGVFSAVAHGLVGMGAFALVGIPSPVLLGVATAISSLIPLVGSALVWGPAVIYLAVTQKIAKAVIIGITAVVVIPLIDNVLRPFLVGSGGKTPFVIILFGILGGLEYFGLLGLIVGPLVLAIFISLVALYWQVATEKEVN